MKPDIERAKAEAEKVIRKYNLEGLSPFPHERIEEDNNLKIFFTNISDTDVSGAISVDDSGSFTILINHSKPQKRQYFTLAHEIGHFFLHQDIIRSEEIMIDGDNSLDGGRVLFRLDQSVSDALETEANNFAACLIMPEQKVKEAWAKLNNVEDCADVFNVSTIAMTIRLQSLKLINE